MKKFLAVLLSSVLFLTGCTTNQVTEEKIYTNEISVSAENYSNGIDLEGFEDAEYISQFNGLSDEKLLQYVENSVYSTLEMELDEGTFYIDEVKTSYYSQEYIDEVAFNSKSNVFFGYTLEELDTFFDNERYVFTLGDDGTTVVKEFEVYDDTLEQVVKNVAIGTGVILILVTVTYVTKGIGTPATVQMIFAASAEGAAEFAISSAAISGTISAITTGIQTGDVKESLKAAALSGSEGYKWGAVVGGLTGAASEAFSILREAKSVKSSEDIIDAVNEGKSLTENTEQTLEAINSEVGSKIPTPQEAEKLAFEKYGGSTQSSFLGGQEVPYGTPGSTRPDIVVEKTDGTLEAIEVKRYELDCASNLKLLCQELKRQVSQRLVDMPEGTTQRIVLNVQGKGYSEEIVNTAIQKILDTLADVYPDIPIDIM